MLQNKKDLIVISSGFPDESGDYLRHTFVKGYVDEAKEYFRRIKVIVLLPHFPLPFGKNLGKFPKRLKNYSYDNVNVIYLKYLYLPLWPLKNIKGKIAYYLLRSKS